MNARMTLRPAGPGPPEKPLSSHFALLDPLLALRNRFTLDWKGAWWLDTPSAWFDKPWPVKVEVVFDDPVPVRPERLIARTRPQQERGAAPDQVRHSAAPSDECRVLLYRDGPGLARDTAEKLPLACDEDLPCQSMLVPVPVLPIAGGGWRQLLSMNTALDEFCGPAQGALTFPFGQPAHWACRAACPRTRETALWRR